MENLKKITLKLIKSPIGATKRQKATLIALGLRHLNHQKEHGASPAVLGMVDKLSRWLEVK
ncbi:MAG: 50S ribosomal protein L30 [Candidatus Riflebacteria bacterium]|nr:50S ribosomal protein L30 [Candidatus Riflebacteria bacterium]